MDWKSERLGHQTLRDITEEYWLPRSLQWLYCGQPGFLTRSVPFASGGTNKREPSWSSEVGFFIIFFAKLLQLLKKPAFHCRENFSCAMGNEVLHSPSAGRTSAGQYEALPLSVPKIAPYKTHPVWNRSSPKTSRTFVALIGIKGLMTLKLPKRQGINLNLKV